MRQDQLDSLWQVKAGFVAQREQPKDTTPTLEQTLNPALGAKRPASMHEVVHTPPEKRRKSMNHHPGSPYERSGDKQQTAVVDHTSTPERAESLKVSHLSSARGSESDPHPHVGMR